ncbi:polyphosphate kinase 1 [bacterium]|nr:polyphosphate kinase 1 [bacterium]
MTEPRFFNRELSWLEFNQRVLDEAHQPALPLLERLKFLAITGSNLDEFVSVRIGSLQLASRNPDDDDSALTAATPEMLVTVLQRTRQFVADQYACLMQELLPALAAAGIHPVKATELNERQARVVESVIQNEVYPVLSAMSIDEEQPFPLLGSLTLHVAVRLTPSTAGGLPRFAVIPFGRQLQRFITLPRDDGQGFLFLEDAVLLHLNRFFPGEKILDAALFRITRNADLELREDLASDLLSGIQEVLEARKESSAVRLEISSEASPELRSFLQTHLQVRDEFVFEIPGPLDLAGLMRLTDSQGFDQLRYEPWPPIANPRIDTTKTMFENIAQGDILLYHPYESFEPVVRFIEESAEDPDVLSIKQTLYRTSARSPIIAALRKAAQRGKYVTALVELKARFDEARNIEWARELERNGVQVIYGVKGLKTHAKICLVVRREPQGLMRYVHFGTGNYNEQTSRLYSDASLMTCDDEYGGDATAFFHAITGYSQPQRFHKIEAAPIGLRERLLEMIEAEINFKKAGKRASILIKLNALLDETMIEALYRASQAGVRVRLNIRGVCSLRPGVPELSENITVTSVVDRFLEHSRLLYFLHGGDERLFISSADWMPRNLDRRVELLVPVEDPSSKLRLLQILRVHFKDNVKARELHADGQYLPLESAAHEPPYRSQEELYRRAMLRFQNAQTQPVEMFEPHRAPSQNP